MKNKILLFVVLSLIVSLMTYGQTNISRLVLGSGNFGTDPNPTADITGQNGEVITNYVNGSWTFGSANLSTTGTFGSGAYSPAGNVIPTTIGTLTNGSSTNYWKGGYFAELFWKSTKLVDSSGNITSGGKIVATDSLRSQGPMTANGVTKFRSNGTIQTYWEDTDATDTQQPFWYLESANNGSKGIFYLGYANRTGSTTFGATDRILIDSVSVTLGTTIGTGTVPLYAGNIVSTGKVVATDSARVQGPLVVNGAASFSNYVFGVDSFSTTAAADTVAITGVTASSFAFVEFYNPPYSATEDTVSHHAICLVSGAGTAQLAVTRAKASPAPAALKSGQHYRYFVKK